MKNEYFVKKIKGKLRTPRPNHLSIIINDNNLGKKLKLATQKEKVKFEISQIYGNLERGILECDANHFRQLPSSDDGRNT